MIIILFGTFAVLRIPLHEKSFDEESGVHDLIDWINSRTDNKFGPGHSGGEAHGRHGASCAWSMTIEICRTALGLGYICLLVRLTEFLYYSSSCGILVVRFERMSVRCLTVWFPFVFLWALGFGLAFNIMAPEFELDGSPGPVRVPRTQEHRNAECITLQSQGSGS
eukprot:5675622-Pleurochrysis_carterae.AAC.3